MLLHNCTYHFVIWQLQTSGIRGSHRQICRQGTSNHKAEYHYLRHTCDAVQSILWRSKILQRKGNATCTHCYKTRKTMTIVICPYPVKTGCRPVKTMKRKCSVCASDMFIPDPRSQIWKTELTMNFKNIFRYVYSWSWISDTRSGFFIQDPGSGSRGQLSTGSRILDPDPQHC